MQIFEATTNLHIPALKCTCPKGTRFYKEDNSNVIKNKGQEFTFDSCFKMLIQHGILKEMTKEEAEKPEENVVPKIAPQYERKKMPVIEETDEIIAIKNFNQKVDKGTAENPKTNSDMETVGKVRGMKVLKEKTSKIEKAPISTKKSETKADKSKVMEKVEARKKERLKKSEEIEKMIPKESTPKETVPEKVASESLVIDSLEIEKTDKIIE